MLHVAIMNKALFHALQISFANILVVKTIMHRITYRACNVYIAFFVMNVVQFQIVDSKV